jgi:hypothetical protein
MPRSTAKKTDLNSEGSVKRKKGIPEKCQKCAMLSAEQAQALHGLEGDGCWNPTVCYSRRSHARHRDRRNQTRSQKRRAALSETITVELGSLNSLFSAVLVVYRKPGADTPVHAIGVEVWKGQEKYAIVQPIHCAGMVPSQVHGYIHKVLAVLEEQYGIRKFASQERLDIDRCPVRPCPHYPELSKSADYHR